MIELIQSFPLEKNVKYFKKVNEMMWIVKEKKISISSI